METIKNFIIVVTIKYLILSFLFMDLDLITTHIKTFGGRFGIILFVFMSYLLSILLKKENRC